MSDDVLDRILRRGDRAADAGPDDEENAPEDCGAFGWLRSPRDRAIMLELRKRNGNVLALGYSWLERAELNPSSGITLFFVGQRVRILGRNLNGVQGAGRQLFGGITTHRVAWVRERQDSHSVVAQPDQCIVEAIEW